MNGLFPLVGIVQTASRSMNDMQNEIRSKGDQTMTALEAFVPVILNQILFTALLIVALAVGVNLHNTLKNIRLLILRFQFFFDYTFKPTTSL